MSSGYAVKAAIKRPAETSTYGTEATSITGQIGLESEGLQANPSYAVSEAVVGRAAAEDVDLVSFAPLGPLSTPLWFEHLEPLFFAMTGYECPDQPATRNPAGTDLGGSPAPNDGSPESFLHIFEPDTNLHREAWMSGERAASGAGDYVWTGSDQKVRTVSLLLDKGVGTSPCEHWVDCMVNKASISGAVGEKPVMCNWDLIPRHRTMVASPGSLVLPGYSPRPAHFVGAKLYCSTPGNALTTELPISEFEFIVDNQLEDAEFDSGGNDLVEGLAYRSEPRRKGPRITTMKMKFARHRAETSLARVYYDSGLEVQLRLVLTGPAISGSAYPYQMVIAIPAAKFTNAQFPVDGPGIIKGEAEVRAYMPPSTAWSRTWVLDAFGGVKRIKQAEFFVALTNTKGGCYSRDRNTTYPLP